MREVLAPPWAAPTWRDEVETWLADTLAGLGLRSTGPLTEHRRRSWSIILTVETNAGRYWVKQNSPSQAFEARLLTALADVAPGRVLVPLAYDEDSGRMLTADQGPTLRDSGRVDADAWTALLVDYAQLQRESASAVPDLGLTALGPADAADYVDRWVEHWAGLAADDPAAMSADDTARLRGLRPQLNEWSNRVLALGLPLTVEHSDLHPGNAFAPAADQPDGPPRVFDFGDAVLAHPLGSLLVPLRTLADPAESGVVGEDAVRSVVDAYLEVWSDLAPMPDLRAAVPAALELGVLGRHESWQRSIAYEDPAAPQPDGFAGAPAAWLSMLGHPLG